MSSPWWLPRGHTAPSPSSRSVIGDPPSRLRVHVIAGPTGVGKTALAERLARFHRSPIVVADRIQCFVDLKVTSARTPLSEENGIARHYLARRYVHQGDLPPRTAAASLGFLLGALATEHPFVVVEGGSISLLKAFFGEPDAWPFDWSVDVRCAGDRMEHRQLLLERARKMLAPPQGGPGLLEELAAAWRIESQRSFVSTINGPEAVLAWCQQNRIDPIHLSQAKLRAEVREELAHAIADAHLVHVTEQEEAFAHLFGRQDMRRLETETLWKAGEPSQSTKPQPSVTVFCGASDGVSPSYRSQAEAVGRHLVEGGFEIVYGGARIGCMGALADGALAAGGRVVGVMPQAMLDYEIAHPGLSELHVVESMHQRKAQMAERGDAFLALPGGLGTAEELLEMLTWRQLGLHCKPVVLLDVDGFWTYVMHAFSRLVDAGFAKPEDLSHVYICPDARSLAEVLGTQLKTREAADVCS